MPIKKVKRGFEFGTGGKVYPTKKKAEKQASAIYSSGWREKK